ATAGALERLLASQSSERNVRSEKIRQIARTYIPNSRDDRVAEGLDDLIDIQIRHLQSIREGHNRNVGALAEGGILAVLGKSGAGKNRVLERQILQRPEFIGFGTPDCLLI